METARDELIKEIFEHRNKGEIVFITIDGLVPAKIEDLIKQLTEGLLYDLNRDVATLLTRYKNTGDLRYINDIAIANVVRYLMNKIQEDGNKS